MNITAAIQLLRCDWVSSSPIIIITESSMVVNSTMVLVLWSWVELMEHMFARTGVPNIRAVQQMFEAIVLWAGVWNVCSNALGVGSIPLQRIII